MKKNNLTYLILSVFLSVVASGNAQCTNCENTNGDMSDFTGTPVTNSNTYINDNLDNWYASHGSPSFGSGDNLNMWSHTGRGEGVYTEFDFESGKTYTICYDILQSATSNPTSESRIALTNGLTPYYGSLTQIPTPTSSQPLPTQPWGTATSNWVTITETFVASSDFSQLWFYPFLAGAASPDQASQRIDNVCISEYVCDDAVANFFLIHENSGDGKIKAFDQSHANNGATIISSVWTVETISTDRDYYPGGGVFSFTAPVSDHYLICLEVITVNDAGQCCKNRFCEWIYIDVIEEACNMEADFSYTCFTDDCIFTFNGNSGNSNRNVRSWFWDFGDGSTGTGKNPYHTYANPGQYEICLTIVGDNDADDGICCYDTYCRTIDFNCTGIQAAITCDEGGGGDPVFNPNGERTGPPNDKTYTPRAFEIFPNPTNDELNIRMEGDLSGATLIVTNLSGNQVMKREMSQNQDTLNVAHLESGIYLITIQFDDGTKVSNRFSKEN